MNELLYLRLALVVETLVFECIGQVDKSFSDDFRATLAVTAIPGVRVYEFTVGANEVR